MIVISRWRGARMWERWKERQDEIQKKKDEIQKEKDRQERVLSRSRNWRGAFQRRRGAEGYE